MQRICVWTAATTLALSSVASAQFSAATSSSQWSPRSRPASAGHLYGYSDCTSENSLGLTDGGEVAWFQGFDHVPGNQVITHIQVSQGWTGSTTGAPAGSVGGVMIYDDPGTDFTDPTDLTADDLDGLASWTTCCPNSDTKEFVVVQAAVIDGFWLAAYLPHAAGEFPAAFDTDTAPSMSRSWVTGSNTTFDPSDPGGGIGFFEMGALGFDAHWLIAGDGGGHVVSIYCTAKSGLFCGTPALQVDGVPKVDATSGFTISALPARGNRVGLLLYGCNGRAAIPFDGGLLCVNPNPLRRTSAVSSGGTNGQCDGVFSIDFNAFATGNLGGNPDPCLGIPWQIVNSQWWGRDSSATGSFLSYGLEFLMAP